MSQHSSLRSQALSGRHRNVLKRYEKVKRLKKEEIWRDGMSVFGLPKIKCVKMKVKKEKGGPKAAEGAESAKPSASTVAATPAGKSAAGASKKA